MPVPSPTVQTQTSPYASAINHHQLPCQAAATSPKRAENDDQKPAIVDESPGLSGLHGAAFLLKEISKGWGAYRRGSSPPPLHLHSAPSQPKHGEARIKQLYPTVQQKYNGGTARSFQWMEEENQFYHDENHHDVAGVLVSALSNPTFAQNPPQLLTPLLLAQRHDLFAVEEYPTSQQHLLEGKVNSSLLGASAHTNKQHYKILPDEHSRDVAATMTQLSVQGFPPLRTDRTKMDEENASLSPLKKSSSSLYYEQQYHANESAAKREEV
jgi:hypothetical protein